MKHDAYLKMHEELSSVRLSPAERVEAETAYTQAESIAESILTAGRVLRRGLDGAWRSLASLTKKLSRLA